MISLEKIIQDNLERSNSEKEMIFLDSILDFMSMEIYKEKENIVLVNSISFLSNLLQNIKGEAYMNNLWEKIMNTHNFYSEKPIVLVAGKDENSKIEEEKDYIYYILGKKTSSTENIILFWNEMIKKGERREVYGQRKTTIK